ncbi:cell envelope integrity protein TolA [Eleftheria terrae]|uniref:cell envelope integrity protein TolA n=1 Tax=Eleftheria terrae TaxID=1597781 RepID=UPI00263B46D5|nr:cell envelope integrity protein TolA [Eleftheria terrae]WKB52405.1 cell envelope integrity protein TolA [Eleftheria terrae]
MNQVTAERDDLLPRPPDRRGSGLLLALVMHGLLIGGLALGLNWRSSEPAAVEAELWAAVPQAAAPAPEPPPPPPDTRPEPTPQPQPEPKPEPKVEPDRQAEIALEKEREKKRREEAREREQEEERERKQREQERREKAEQERKDAERKRELAEAERKKREEADRKTQEAKQRREEQDKRLQAQRSERLKRLQAEAGTGSAEQGAANGGLSAGGPSAGYAGKLKARILPNIVYADTTVGNPAAEVEVKAAPNGTILGSRLVKSSGNPEWDQAVLRAIDKTQTLPRDENGRVPSPLLLTFRPRDM